MEEFKKELAELLRKHEMYIVAKSNLNNKDYSVEIGFQTGFENTNWVGRHHLGAYDIDGIQSK